MLGEAIKWNFTKFLVGRDGSVLKRYAPTMRRNPCAKGHRSRAFIRPDTPMFSHVEPLRRRSILSLNEDFQKIRARTRSTCRSASISTTPGASRCSIGQACGGWWWPRRAKPYLPIEGAANFRAAVCCSAPTTRR